MQLEVIECRSGAVEDLIAGVRRYNDDQAGPGRSTPLAVLARGDDGALVGGVSGRTVYQHFLIEAVWVVEHFRGQSLGMRLMEFAEQVALTRGCVAAQVDTLSFQAPGFYRKLGFEVVGTIRNFPVGHERYFMLKRYRRPTTANV